MNKLLIFIGIISLVLGFLFTAKVKGDQIIKCINERGEVAYTNRGQCPEGYEIESSFESKPSKMNSTSKKRLSGSLIDLYSYPRSMHSDCLCGQSLSNCYQWSVGVGGREYVLKQNNRIIARGAAACELMYKQCMQICESLHACKETLKKSYPRLFNDLFGIGIFWDTESLKKLERICIEKGIL